MQFRNAALRGGGRRRLAVLSITAVAIAGTLAGCSSAGTSGTSASAQSVKVGVILGLTGAQAAIENDSKLGVEAGIAYVNSHGGVLGGRKLSATILDNANEPTNSASDARQLIQQNVTAVIGDMQTTTVAAEAPLFNQAKIPVFTSATGSNLWVSSADSYLFGTGDESQYNAEVDADYLVKDLHIKKIGIIYQNDGFGAPTTAATVTVLKSLGVTPVGSQPFDPTATDVTAQLNNLKSAGAEAVIAWTYGPGLVAVARGEQSVGWQAPTVTDTGLSQSAVVSGSGAAQLKNFYGGPTVKNFLSAKEGGPVAPAAAAFMTEFRKVFGTGGFDGQQLAASQAYDSVVVLAQAINKAKSLSGPAIKKALESGTTFTGARTTYKFSASEHVGENFNSLGLFVGGVACNITCFAAPKVNLDR